jgi:hypothetical protein
MADETMSADERTFRLKRICAPYGAPHHEIVAALEAHAAAAVAAEQLRTRKAEQEVSGVRAERDLARRDRDEALAEVNTLRNSLAKFTFDRIIRERDEATARAEALEQQLGVKALEEQPDGLHIAWLRLREIQAGLQKSTDNAIAATCDMGRKLVAAEARAEALAKEVEKLKAELYDIRKGARE